MNTSFIEINNKINNFLIPIFSNKIFISIIGLFFVLYAGILAPALPNRVIYLFDTIYGKFLFIFVLSFVSSRNIKNSFQISLIISLIFIITLSLLEPLKMKHIFTDVSLEKYNNLEYLKKKEVKSTDKYL